MGSVDDDPTKLMEDYSRNCMFKIYFPFSRQNFYVERLIFIYLFIILLSELFD